MFSKGEHANYKALETSSSIVILKITVKIEVSCLFITWLIRFRNASSLI